MSTTNLRADEVMNRAASLMNDTARSVYTYVAVLPYLNMAIDELQEELQLANMSPSVQIAAFITLAAGLNKITPTESETLPHYPYDLVEPQVLSERDAGSSVAFVGMNRKDDISPATAISSLVDWAWINQEIVFNPNGATSDREIRLDYVRQPLQMALNENSIIGAINSRSYLSFKTAEFCARFIGENETRASELKLDAETALDRLLGIGAKGRQSIYTRRRPFRAAFKARGW